MGTRFDFKKLILCILSVKDSLYQAYGADKTYGSILNYLMSKDFYYDDTVTLPSLKSTSDATGINTYQLKKRLEALYELALDTENGPVLEFNSLEIWCFASSYQGASGCRLHPLTQLPRIGEQMTIPVFRTALGTDMFYVSSIDHTLEQGKQLIILNLQDGLFDPYWEFRKAEAIAKGEISFNEQLSLSEFEMKRKLGVR